MSSYIKKVDVFPATVFLAPPSTFDSPTDFTTAAPRPEGTRKVDRCRITIFNGSLYIVQDSPEGPKLVFREKVLFHETSKTDKGLVQHHAVTQTGKILLFFKDDSCGCGSRLRSWSPFGNIATATGDPDA